MNVVYCTTVLPSQRRTGGEIASQAFVNALRAAGHSVSVLGYRRPADLSSLGEGEMIVGIRPIESDGAGRHAVWWVLRALFRGRPYSCEKYLSKAYLAKVKTQLDMNPGALVVIDHAQMAAVADRVRTSHPIVFVAHNVEEHLYRSQLTTRTRGVRRWIIAREAGLIGIQERRMATRAIATWCLTEHDAEVFRKTCRKIRVARFDLPGLEQQEMDSRQVEVQWDVGLIGTWTWGANAEGLRWFMEMVVPQLPSELRIAVAGKGADGIVSDSVSSLGFVDNAMEFMHSCRLICVPSVAGAGVQIKTIDAIASGRPIVATSIALRGIGNPPASVSIADGPDEFAGRIVDVLGQSSDCTLAGIDWAKQRHVEFAENVQRSVEQIRAGAMNKVKGRVHLFGIDIDPLAMKDAVARVASWLKSDERFCRYVVTPNVDHVVKLRKQVSFRDAYENAALVLADGKPVVAAARLFGDWIPETVPGSDLVPEIFSHFQSCEQTELKVFLLGAAPGVAELAAQRIHSIWPLVKVVGMLSPDFGFERDPFECDRICATVAESGADLLVIGLGAPKQELWVHRHASKLPVKAALCVGATIDFLAGQRQRAPRWMRKCALEWVHRMVSEPRRLGRRYLQDAFVFPGLLYKEWRSRS